MAEVFLGSVYAQLELRTDQFQSQVAAAKSQLSDLGNETASQTTSMGAAFSNLGGALEDFGRASLIPAAAIGLLGKTAIDMGSAFEDSMAKVAAVSNLTISPTDEAFQKLRATAVQLGIDTRFTADQAARGLYELASAGLAVEDQISTLPAVLDLATVAQIDVGEAANRVVAQMKAFSSTGLTASQATDQMSRAVNMSLLHFEDLSNGLRFTGASFGTMKQPMDEAITALAALADQGYKGAQAGEYLRQVMQYMNPVTNKSIAAFEELGIITEDGKNQFFDAAGAMKPFSENLELLRQKTAGLTDEERSSVLQRAFALQGAQAMNSLLSTSRERYDQLHNSIRNSNGATKEAADVMNSTLRFQMDQLTSSVETAGISFTTAFTPALTKALGAVINLVNGFTAFSEANPGVVSAIGVTLAGFVGLVAVINIGVVAFGLISTAVGVFSAAVGVMTAFMALAIAPFILIAAAVAAVTVAVGYLVIKSGMLETAQDKVTRAMKENQTAAENTKVAVDNLKAANDNLEDADRNLERATLNLDKAQFNYTETMKNHLPTSFEGREATLNLKDAQDSLKSATDKVAESEVKANDTLLEWIDTEGKSEVAANNLAKAQVAPETAFGRLKNSIGDAISKLREWIGLNDEAGNYGGGGITSGGSGGAYASGGWVSDTEMALVHKGEYVLSKEMLAGTSAPDRSVVDAIGQSGQSSSPVGNITNSPTFNVNVGIYAGSQMEKRAMAKEIFDAYDQYQQGIGALV